MTEVMVTEVPWEYNLSVEKLAADPNGDLYIAGYASNGNVDEDGEVMDLDSLRSVYKQYMENPVIKLMHDKVPQWKGAIGRVVPEYTDVEGIVHKTSFGSKPYLVIKLARGLPEWIYSSVKDGVYKGLSIGGKLAKKVGNRLYVKSWLETSLVDIPSAKGSFVEVLKAAGESSTLQEEEPIKESEVITKFLNSIQETTQAKKLEEASTGINSFLKGGVGSGIKGHRTYHTPEPKKTEPGLSELQASMKVLNYIIQSEGWKVKSESDKKAILNAVKRTKEQIDRIQGKPATPDERFPAKKEQGSAQPAIDKEEAKKQAKRERAAKRRAAKKRREDLPTHTETIENGKKVLARIREGAGGETGASVGEGPGTSKEEERKAKRRERAKKRREAKKTQSEPKQEQKSEPKKSGVSSLERMQTARAMVLEEHNVEVFLNKSGGKLALDHFYKHYGPKSLDYFKTHSKIFYDDERALRGDHVLGNCIYFSNGQQVINLRDQTWKTPRESSYQTTVHELTHSLYSDISAKSRNSVGRVVYEPSKALNEGIAVLGVNMTGWAPHSFSYMQYACATMDTLMDVSKEEGVSVKDLYKNLSNVSPLPIEERIDLRGRMESLYYSKHSKVSYTKEDVIRHMESWRDLHEQG